MSTNRTKYLKTDIVYCQNSLEKLKDFPDESVHCCVTDPPYGINMLDSKVFRDKFENYQKWTECWASEMFRILKPGGSLFCFSATKSIHRCMVGIEDAGFEIKDLIMCYLEGMPKTQGLGILFDEMAGETRDVVSHERPGLVKSWDKDSWKSGIKSDEPKTELGAKWNDWKTGTIKPMYEPICWAYKRPKIPIYKNVLKNELGAMNFGECRFPDDKYENRKKFNSCSGGKKGIYGNKEIEPLWLPNEKGRVPGNIVRTNKFGDEFDKNTYLGTDKLIYVKKPQPKETQFCGDHITIKPIKLMSHLIKLVTIKNQIVIDPFCGTGSTLIAAQINGRKYIGIDIEEEFVNISKKRLNLYPKYGRGVSI
jgi:site-specific DNA-methyltransferase (adenine-specific)